MTNLAEFEKCIPGDGEPFFVLLGRDPQAPALVDKWAHDRALLEPDGKKPDRARDIAFAMREFKETHPDLGLPPIKVKGEQLLIDALAAAQRYNDYCHENEAQYTGWGEQTVPQSVERARIESTRAYHILLSIRNDKAGVKTKPSVTLLKLEAGSSPVFIILDNPRNAGETIEQIKEHQQYVFEEHSCPANWMPQCVAIIQDGDPDPHGFLTFVRSADVPEGFETYGHQDWDKIFPEAFAADEKTQPDDAVKLIGDVLAALDSVEQREGKLHPERHTQFRGNVDIPVSVIQKMREIVRSAG